MRRVEIRLACRLDSNTKVISLIPVCPTPVYRPVDNNRKRWAWNPSLGYIKHYVYLLYIVYYTVYRHVTL
jgi:hypothetical protein